MTKFLLPLLTVAALSVRAAEPISPNRSANLDARRNVVTESGFVTDTNRAFPMLFIVGDSTVHNPGRGERGWGDVIGKYFDPNKIRVENHALGGRSSRTFITQGWWDKILAAAKPGDFVLIQMGHNDGGPLDDTNRARGTLRGIGDEAKEIYNPIMKKPELVHTYGWYLREYISDARACGMTPIICSPVPHCPKTAVKAGAVENWDYVRFAGEIATNENAPFINLNELVISLYAGMMPAEIKAKYFTAADNTHSSPAGAELNAQAVVTGLRALTDCPLKNYLAAPEFPREWIDPDTGHRVVQLSTEPGSGSLYFNLNPFTPDGKKMVVTTPGGISMVNLETQAVEKIMEGRVRIIMVGRKTGKIYFGETKIADGATNRYFCSIDPTTRAVQVLLKLQPGQEACSVNADETLLAGTITEPDGPATNDFSNGGPNQRNGIATASAGRRRRGQMMEDRFARHYPMELFFYNLATGETRKVNRCTDWLNHLQFSPTDPNRLMFCHEGPWQKVDRIWTIRTDGSDLKLIHRRTMSMEIAGHEFWSADGKTIWYDLQTPRGEDFWVAGYEIATGKRTWYHLQRDEWGVHFNVSPDGKLFSSDGGDDKMVAHATNGQWLYLFRPELVSDRSAGSIDTKNLIQPGVFHAEKLVNMSKHNYALEPNAMFSPDMKWLIFRSNMSGAEQVYAVELEKRN